MVTQHSFHNPQLTVFACVRDFIAPFIPIFLLRRHFCDSLRNVFLLYERMKDCVTSHANVCARRLHQYMPSSHCQVTHFINFLLLNEGTEDDLEYYVRECGDILGVGSKLPADCRDAKHILDYIFHQVVEFKKLNQVSFAFWCKRSFSAPMSTSVLCSKVH